jgi:single-strand DNA-binding protein
MNMSFRFDGEGNLGDAPAIRTVNVNGEQRTVADVSIYFDNMVSNNDTAPNAPKYIDKGGFWGSGSLWDSQAQMAEKLLAKGARVRASGSMVQRQWKDKDGNPRVSFQLRIDKLNLVLSRVAEVKMKPKSDGASGGYGDNEHAANDDAMANFDDADIPQNAYTN